MWVTFTTLKVRTGRWDWDPGPGSHRVPGGMCGITKQEVHNLVWSQLSLLAYSIVKIQRDIQEGQLTLILKPTYYPKAGDIMVSTCLFFSRLSVWNSLWESSFHINVVARDCNVHGSGYNKVWPINIYF